MHSCFLSDSPCRSTSDGYETQSRPCHFPTSHFQLLSITLEIHYTALHGLASVHRSTLNSRPSFSSSRAQCPLPPQSLAQAEPLCSPFPFHIALAHSSFRSRLKYHFLRKLSLTPKMRSSFLLDAVLDLCRHTLPPPYTHIEFITICNDVYV